MDGPPSNFPQFALGWSKIVIMIRDSYITVQYNDYNNNLTVFTVPGNILVLQCSFGY